MTIWLFSSNNKAHIRTAFENFIWGFWDKPCGNRGKLARNWRDFITKYNNIKPFDIAVFQIARGGNIHALGIIKETGYDDQTPVWKEEKEKNKVIFPWRVYFSIMLYSEEPVVVHFTRKRDYVDGYGIGTIEQYVLEQIIEKLHKKALIRIRT